MKLFTQEARYFAFKRVTCRQSLILVMVLINGLMLPMRSFGEMRDPTQPNYPMTSGKALSAKGNTDATPVLSAIWISTKSRHATLNGITGKEGQTILNTVQIISIRPNRVVIKQNNTLKTLQLVQRANQNPSMLKDE